GMVCVVGRMRDLILQLSKSSIYSTKPPETKKTKISTIESVIILFSLPLRLGKTPFIFFFSLVAKVETE
ncbi:hypothetical protein NL386_31600, partial [Klebsiella pneumoniae]|nr:hypothetical protein [Klebsiella pneumoniae]